MQAYADKNQENKSHLLANSISERNSGSKSTLQFVDNRSEAIQIRKLQEKADNYSHKNSFQFVENRLKVAQIKRIQNLVYLSIQFDGHRPVVGMTIDYQNNNYTVQVSAPNNPEITIHRPPNNAVHINWQTADFTINRQDSAQDHDLRRG
jgi:hypothetical protein